MDQGDPSDDERQMRREMDARQQAADECKRIADSTDPSYSPITAALVREHLKPLAEAIDAEQAKVRSGQIPKRCKYAVPLASIDPFKLAVLTLRTIVGRAWGRRSGDFNAVPRARVARALGALCRLERQFDIIQQREFLTYQDLLRTYSSEPKRARQLARQAVQRLDAEDWSHDNRDLHLGKVLIDLAVQTSKIARIEDRLERDRGRPRHRKLVCLTEDALGWLASRETTALNALEPFNRPMVARPTPWMALQGGGYKAGKALVKTRGNRKMETTLAGADLSAVYSAVNALQDTRWKVNSAVLSVAREAASRRLRIKCMGLPKHRYGRKLEVFQYPRCLKEAESLACEAKLFFPYYLDFRGRAYPWPEALNPQGNDLSKALLTFADGKPLGEAGERWLAIHLANMMGIGKETYDIRKEWTTKNTDRIIAAATDPWAPDAIWLEAKKPWRFLAACFEWKQLREHGPWVISSLPVSVDGTCNGLQHLSALARDEKGGKATNLLRSGVPHDIYELVEARVKARIAADSNAGVPGAACWVDKVDRDTVKKATMATPYGITERGIRDHLWKEEFTRSLPDRKVAMHYLSATIRAAIDQIVVTARATGSWLASIAAALRKKHRPVIWTVPSGFRVLHERRTQRGARVNVLGQKIRIRAPGQAYRLHKIQQEEGIVPNFVHSLDAAHLVMTINRLRDEDLRHFLAVHDNFGVHACDMPRLNRVIREEFVRLHERPLLEEFVQEQRAMHPDVTFEDPPPGGELGISEVLEAEYFFT